MAGVRLVTEIAMNHRQIDLKREEIQSREPADRGQGLVVAAEMQVME